MQWDDLLDLGDEMLRAERFSDQRDLILGAVKRLLDGEARVWLNESRFRLPDWDQSLFEEQPPSTLMQQAFDRVEAVFADEDRSGLALPIQNQGEALGVLEYLHPQGSPLRKREILALESLCRTAALALLAWHQLVVERWRIDQLGLVRGVSAQVASVLDLDELARRSTLLIQQTFNYYYVAIFTLEQNQQMLRLRGSAVQKKRGRAGKRSHPAVEVQVGQGMIGLSALTGEEIVSNDVSSEPRFRYIDSLPETQSEVTLALQIEDRILGVLDVQSDRLGAFHPNDLIVLRALADTIAIAVEDARIYSELRSRADHLEVISELSNLITSTLDLDEMMHQAARLINEKLDFPNVHLFTVHNVRRQIQYRAGSGDRSQAFEGFILELDTQEGIIPWVARQGQTILANDVTLEPRYRPSPFPPENTRSELAVPMLFDGQVLGILDVQSDRVGAFSEDDRRLFESLVDSIAIAIHNSELFRSEQWRRQVADSLREVAGLLSANVSLDQLMDAILSELERNLPCDVSAIWLLNEDGITLAAVHGVEPARLEAAYFASPDSAAMLIRGLNSEAPLVRTPSDPLGPTGLAMEFDPQYSSIAAPLLVGNQPVGVLTLSHHTAGRYGRETQAMTATFASYAAVAIENARLFDTAQQQAYASAALLQSAHAVVSLTELDEILSTIVRILPILVGVERCAVYLWDPDWEVYRPGQAYGIPAQAREEIWQDVLMPGEFPLLDAASADGRLVVAALHEPRSEPASWPQILPPASDEEVLAALDGEDPLLVAFPLVARSEVLGVLLFEEASDGKRFRERRLEIITGIAQQLSLAIQNQHLQSEAAVQQRLEHEIQLARQIQQTFIPERMPELPGWALAARWRTAREVGGDFYDLIILPEKRLGIFIADVADKGMPAALFMALTRTLVRAATAETGSPAQVLSRVNDLLYPDCQQGMFVTAAYLVLDVENGLVTYANAGHNPPLWLKTGGGAVERLTRTGIALGVVDKTPYEEHSLQLEDGDLLVLYTDGITETFSPQGEAFGEQRLIDIMSSNPQSSVLEALNAIEDAINQFMGLQPLSDDLTMLAVRRG